MVHPLSRWGSEIMRRTRLELSNEEDRSKDACVFGSTLCDEIRLGVTSCYSFKRACPHAPREVSVYCIAVKQISRRRPRAALAVEPRSCAARILCVRKMQIVRLILCRLYACRKQRWAPRSSRAIPQGASTLKNRQTATLLESEIGLDFSCRLGAKAPATQDTRTTNAAAPMRRALKVASTNV